MSNLKTIESPVGAEILLDGKRYINFCGASYLGLAGNTEVIQAGITALRESGSGAQIARHYDIVTRAHQEVESEAARFFDTQSALYLSGGYYFGHVSLSAMRSSYNTVFYDEWAHFSLRDGSSTWSVRRHAGIGGHVRGKFALRTPASRAIPTASPKCCLSENGAAEVGVASRG